jgi:hypothetical protein
VECKNDDLDRANEYNKLDSFFDHFGGEEENDSLDESESLKTSKDECDETVPEWVNAEFSGELQFENGQEKKQPVTNIESDNSYKSPKSVESVRGEVDETALMKNGPIG